ncbi:NADH:flavin oxidoreductase/NADH oxidase [Mycena latifolia]|nr:NADH:flavin oxidoreductase/NADH oxidase [Mycena latifolia]
MSSPKLFQPTQIGDIQLSHRVVFAPTTRFRADANHVPLPHVAEYYEQRASTPGSLLITEATTIAGRAAGYRHVPGVWSDAQIASWKTVADRVHAKGSYIFLQLYALGRAAEPEALAEEHLPYVSASAVPLTGGQVPRALTIEEIKEYMQLWATAASNAVHKAGFDGVEIHGANGYLIDQFLHESSNIRTDTYGGSAEKRTLFALEVAEAVVSAVGQKRTAFRISPWGTYLDMQFDHPKPTYAHLVTQLRDRYPELAYLHIVEPRADGNGDMTTDRIKESHSNDFIREIWGGRPLISAGGYTRETAIAVAEEKGDLVAFGRGYLANVTGPAIPTLARYRARRRDRALYYAPGSADPRGYTDYAFATPTVEAH